MKRILSAVLTVVMLVTSVSITNFVIGSEEVIASDDQTSQACEIELNEYVNSEEELWGKTIETNVTKDEGVVTFLPDAGKQAKFQLNGINVGGYVVVDMTFEWDKDNAVNIPRSILQSKSIYSDGNTPGNTLLEIAYPLSNKAWIKIAGSNTILDMSTTNTANVTLCFDFFSGANGTYDVYLNGQLKKADCAHKAFSDLTEECYFSYLEWYTSKSDATNQEGFQITKFQVYEGTKPRDLSATVTPGDIALGETQVAEGLPTMTLNTELASLFTVAEKEFVLVDSKDANFYLDVAKDTTDLRNLANVQACDGVGQQFAVTLYKQFGTGVATAADGYEVNISVAVPDSLKTSDTDVKRIYKIFQLSASENEIVATQVISRYDDVLTFDAVSGASYVLAYVDAKETGITMNEYYNAAKEAETDPVKAGMSITNKDNTITYSADDNEFTLAALNSSDFLMQKNGLTNVGNRYMILQTKIAWTETVPTGSIRFRSDANVQYNLLFFSETKGLAIGEWNEEQQKPIEKTVIAATNFKENTYYDVAVAIDWQKSAADVYINNELKIENVALRPEYTFSALRVYMYSDNAVGATIKLKDVKLYEGTKPVNENSDVEAPGQVSVTPVVEAGLPTIAASADLSSTFTTLEKESILLHSKNAEVFLNIAKNTATTTDTIEVLKNYTVTTLFDASLSKQVGGGEIQPLGNGTSVNVVLTIPEAMKGPDTVKRIFTVFELTEESGTTVATTLGSWSTTELDFAVKAGTTYVLAYQDIVEQAFINTDITEDYGLVFKENGNTIEYSSKNDTFLMKKADNDMDFYFQKEISDEVVRHMVVQMKISWKDAIPSGVIQFPPSKTGFTLFTFNKSGIGVAGTNILAADKFTEGTEYEVAAVIDWEDSTVDAYLNGKLIKENIQIKDKDSRAISYIRVYMANDSTVGATALIKNFTVYEGMEPVAVVNGSVTTTVNDSGAPVSVTLNDSTAKLAYALLDTYDLAGMMGDATKPGKDLSLILTASKSSKTASSVLKDYTGGQLFDLKLTKKIGNGAEEIVTTTGDAVSITVSVPQWLLNIPVSGKGRTYQIVRVNADGTVKNVPASYNEKTKTLTFAADTFSATYAVAYDDIVVGDKIFLNTVPEGLTALTGDGKTKDYVSEAIDEKRLVYDYIKMPTQNETYYLQKLKIDPTRFMVVHMKLAWEDAIPEMNLAWRDNVTNKDGTLLRVATDGRIFACTDEKTTMQYVGASISSKQNEYTEIAFVIDWKTHLADIYVGDMTKPIQTGWQLQTSKAFTENDQQVVYDFNSVQMFRMWMSSVTKAADSEKGVNGSLYVKDWTIYENDVPKDINAGLSNGLAKTGDTLFLNTIRNGLKGIKSVHSNNLIEVRNNGKSNQYIHTEVLNTDSSYTQFEFNNTTRYMVFHFKWAWEGNFPYGAFEYKDLNYLNGNIFQMKQNKLLVGSSVIVSNPKEGQYYDIAIAVDWETHLANVWLDGKLVKINIQLPTESKGQKLESIKLIRTMLYGKGNNKIGTIMKLKDWVIYEGTSPRKITGDMETSAIPVIELDDTTALKLLGNNVAMALKSDEIYYNGAKHDIGVAACEQDDTALFPVKAIAAAYGLTYKIGGSKATIKGVSVPISKINGEAYLSVKALQTLASKALGGKTVTYEERGFVVIGNSAFTTDEDDRKEVLHYLLYDRPSTGEIASIMKKATTHPSVIMNADMVASVKENYETDVLMEDWGDYIIKQANNRLLMKIPEYKLTNGQLLTVSRRVYSDAQYFGMAYILTKDMKYVNALYRVYEAAGNFQDWNKAHFLDTAEMMMAFTIGYDWLYDVWTPAQRAFLEKTIYEKGLKVAYDIYYSLDIGYEATWWVYTVNNWAAVCHGSILSASVALYDKHPEFCATTISYSIRALEGMMDEFYPSGAWSEGPDYWSYTLAYLQNMFSTMDATFGTDYGLSKAPSFDKTVDYYLAVNGPAGQNNYHDTTDDKILDGKSLMWLAQKFDISYVMEIRKAQIVNEQANATVWDLIFYNENLSEVQQNEKMDYYLEDLELVSLRESFEDFESAWVSFHAGESNTGHGHLDTGSYVVDMLGERWAVDLGSDNYGIVGYDVSNQQKTYTVYRKRPEGHNLYVINPQTDRYYPGQTVDNFTEIETFETKSRGAFSIIDLTKAYKRDVTAAKRGYMLANDRRSVVIRDELTFTSDANTFYWFNHINDETTAEVVDKNTVILTQNGQTVKMLIATNLEDYEVSIVDAEPLEWTPLVDGQNENEDIHKIQIRSEKASGDVWVQVKFIPFDDPAANEPFENIALADWSIPDGELERLPNAPMLKGIYRDGKKLYNFKKSTLTYTLTVPYNVDELPEITAKADDDCNVEITPAKGLDEYTEIKVSWKDCPESYRIYRVKVIQLDKLEDVYGYYRLQVYDHSASAEPEANHPVLKLSDNDLDPESRWVANGEQWACLDLGSEKKFEALALAWWKGDTRTYYFTIEISNDGENFIPLLENRESNGTSAVYELFVLDEQVSARYIRYRGYGNTDNEYNSLTEFAVLTKELQEEAISTWSTPVIAAITISAVTVIAVVGFGIWYVINKKKKKVVESADNAEGTTE